MATSFADAGPLDEYFRDEIDSSNEHRPVQGQNLDMEMELNSQNRRSSGLSDESGDITLVDRSSLSPNTLKGWTGSLPNSAGPSNTNNTFDVNVLVPGKFPSPSRISFSDETFAEKFRYLICSSGLLEKDYVPALSGGLESELGDDIPGNNEETWKVLEGWIQKGKERWDLVLAGLALLVGLMISLGLWTILGMLSVGILGIGWYTGLAPISKDISNNTTAASDHDTPQSAALTSLTNFVTQSQNLNNTLLSSLSLLEPHPYNLYTHNPLRVTLHRFTGNMTDHLATATSTLLELTDRRELAVLGEMYDIPVVGSFFYSRGRKHHSITDSSSEEEYDQPISNQRPGLPHRPSSHPSPQRHIHASHNSTSSLPVYASSSPLKKLHSAQRISFSSSPGGDDRFTQLPDKTPRLSKRASVERLRDLWSQSPRYERPRHERRITEADEEAENEDTTTSDQSMSSDDITPVKLDRRDCSTDNLIGSTVVSPKSPPAAGRAGLGVTIPRTPILTRETSRGSSASPLRHIPSPLSRRLSNASERLQPLRTAAMATPSRSLPGSTTLLPSPFMSDQTSASDIVPPSSAPLRAVTSLDPLLSTSEAGASGNPKRRSLQNMVYYHSSDENDPHQSLSSGPLSAGLTRTRSMPLSDLQALRSASTAGGRGGRSRRSSLNPSSIRSNIGLGIGIGFPPDRKDKRASLTTLPPASPDPSLNLNLRRVESISPLTTPSLKASCLGIHLKRRRMTCCLLGLKFRENQDDGYWREVKGILDDLVYSMIEEKRILEEVLKDSEREERIIRLLNSDKDEDFKSNDNGLSDIWSPSPIESVFPEHKRDFAPKTPDEVLLNEHMDKLAQALIGSWKELSKVRHSLGSNSKEGQGLGLMDNWIQVRSKLGDGIREWERGKEVILRMTSQNHGSDNVRVSSSTEDDQRQSVEQEKDVRQSISPLPEFMKAWTTTDDDENQDQESADKSLEDAEEPLPPVGKDLIFEATSSIPLNEDKVLLSKMRREDRIKLTKQAREKGISVVELLKDRNGLGDQKEKDVREMKIRSGQVVDELRGVIGSIRRMKVGDLPGEDGLSMMDGHAKGTGVKDFVETTSLLPSLPIPLSDRQLNEKVIEQHISQGQDDLVRMLANPVNRNDYNDKKDERLNQDSQIRLTRTSEVTNPQDGQNIPDDFSDRFMLDLNELKRNIRPMNNNDSDEDMLE
ncbi:hypothetical protein I203_103582 [Kwoniella mangroviensis CBS 8507]|uniref:uncharacterized protein n=1 Tax=Kwoniella mangroviensis CBS 8507 TaxID=1296122 RepID=UPI00080D205F|nr:uncharacterized protein I203_04320 [Kwoniella mangroviensis CBS 8507]OCF66744.1 hypothetical protein I203_04320 [Kwoniella mangroviensis CBS 8507]